MVFDSSVVGGPQSPAGERLRTTDFRWLGGCMATGIWNDGEWREARAKRPVDSEVEGRRLVVPEKRRTKPI